MYLLMISHESRGELPGAFRPRCSIASRTGPVPFRDARAAEPEEGLEVGGQLDLTSSHLNGSHLMQAGPVFHLSRLGQFL